MSTNKFSKTELQIYILLLCANADSVETEDEINLIKSKVDEETFNKIYKVFSNDNDDERLEKIDDNIHHHEFTNMELAQLRREIYEIFFSDCDFKMMERNLDRILDNILY
ncbi:hypothetical protein C1T31_03930 [Hanstruepera neustonica]|uniref:TerB family tellurite resistance protein n=1 Tax=Hanstruepera neustonica TaxID=1445657 RepID=A0A2K1E4Y2_9FLAO|nr:hypothetical protein [Hanstruepera neustonica]PNQ75291.1 hypothetical protein C1T31_03930 [Hanstruepera neustonica]